MHDQGAQPLVQALSAVGDRWTLLVVATLLEAPRRFNDLQADLAGIAPNVLTQRLRHLEAEGVLLARPYSERPPRFLYELTASGRALAGTVRELTAWGARHRQCNSAPRHAACGTELQATWYCPTCRSAVADRDVDELDHA